MRQAMMMKDDTDVLDEIDKCSGFICGVREAADEQDAPRAFFHDKKQEGPVRTENGRLAGRLGPFHHHCRGGGGFRAFFIYIDVCLVNDF